MGKFIEAEVLNCWFIWTFTDPASDALPPKLGTVARTLALALLILPRTLCEQVLREVLREQSQDGEAEPTAVLKSKLDEPKFALSIKAR